MTSSGDSFALEFPQEAREHEWFEKALDGKVHEYGCGRLGRSRTYFLWRAAHRFDVPVAGQDDEVVESGLAEFRFFSDDRSRRSRINLVLRCENGIVHDPTPEQRFSLEGRGCVGEKKESEFLVIRDGTAKLQVTFPHRKGSTNGRASSKIPLGFGARINHPFHNHQVAISYAEEDTVDAHTLRQALAREGVQAFTYQQNQEILVSRKLDATLQAIFGDRACVIVILFSPSHEKKRWTQFETEVAVAAGAHRVVLVKYEGVGDFPSVDPNIVTVCSRSLAQTLELPRVIKKRVREVRDGLKLV